MPAEELALEEELEEDGALETPEASASSEAGGDDRTAAWEAVLDELQQRLVRYQRALQGAGPMPEPYVPPELAGPMPSHLAPRARLILAGQRDVEYQLRARMGALSAALDTAGRPVPAPRYVDRRS